MSDDNGSNFESDAHAIRTGLLVSLLLSAGLDAAISVDKTGAYCPVIRIAAGGATYDVELLDDD